MVNTPTFAFNHALSAQPRAAESGDRLLRRGIPTHSNQKRVEKQDEFSYRVAIVPGVAAWQVRSSLPSKRRVHWCSHCSQHDT